MSLKQLIYGTGAAVLVAGGLMSGSLAYAQTPSQAEVDQAIAVAQGQFPGGTVQEVEAERENGRMVYEVEILAADGTLYEVEVDASGNILEIEREDDEDDEEDEDDGDTDD